MTPEQIEAFRWEKEIDERNRPLTDEELDAMFPFDGYKVGFVIISVVNNDHCTTLEAVLTAYLKLALHCQS